MAVEVVQVSRDQWREVADIETRAFENDPAARTFMPDRAQYYRFMGPFKRFGVRLNMLSGKLVEATTSMTATATWSPPGVTYSRWAMLRLLPQFMRTRRLTTKEQYQSLMRWLSEQDQRRVQLLPEPHWNLDILAVDPDKQRFGLGAVLVRHGLTRAANAKQPAYVEAHESATARFYGKCGFELMEHVDDGYPPLKIPAWRMVHRPGPPANS